MQVLVYPHTSTATQKFDSYVKYKDAPYMSFDVLEWFVIKFVHCKSHSYNTQGMTAGV